MCQPVYKCKQLYTGTHTYTGVNRCTQVKHKSKNTGEIREDTYIYIYMYSLCLYVLFLLLLHCLTSWLICFVINCNVVFEAIY